MIREKGLRQHARKGHIVLGDDGCDGQIRHAALAAEAYDLRNAFTAVTRAGVPPKRYATSTAS
jgi:hypothetical protein